jgi:predicted Rossmann-fold nucleotide-binding protein
MEELFEVLCWWHLGLHPKPVGILNVAGLYDGLLAYLRRAAEDGFIGRELLVVADDVDALLDGVTALLG